MKTRLLLILSLILLGTSLAAWNSFGAFSVVTEPAGASVTILGTNVFLGNSPTQQFPLYFNQNIVWNGGIAGHLFDLQIHKDGYYPIVQRIFVPLNAAYPSDAEKNPTVYNFKLYPLQYPPAPYYYPSKPRPPHYYQSQPQHPKQPSHHTKPPRRGNQKLPNKMKPPRKK